MDESTLNQLIEKAVTEISVAESGPLAYLGDKLGLYRAMAGAGPLTSAELAGRTGTHERYVREWLHNQAAGGWVRHHAEQDSFELCDEAAQLFADEDSPMFLGGAFEMLAALWADVDRLAEAFRTGAGLGWGEHDPRLYSGVARFFRPAYRASLTTEWLPALDGVVDRLHAGVRVADVGCGHGASTLIMAEAYPRSTFVGYDSHPDSIAAATKAAAEAGLTERVTFVLGDATALAGFGYDLICFFDCLHDMGDPIAAAASARRALTPRGTVMLVEPLAGDTLAENLHPVGRLYYAASTQICTPSSLAQPGGLGLGAQAGPARLGSLLAQAGLPNVRTAVTTPFNVVLEARP